LASEGGSVSCIFSFFPPSPFSLFPSFRDFQTDAEVAPSFFFSLFFCYHRCRFESGSFKNIEVFSLLLPYSFSFFPSSFPRLPDTFWKGWRRFLLPFLFFPPLHWRQLTLFLDELDKMANQPVSPSFSPSPLRRKPRFFKWNGWRRPSPPPPPLFFFCPGMFAAIILEATSPSQGFFFSSPFFFSFHPPSQTKNHAAP